MGRGGIGSAPPVPPSPSRRAAIARREAGAAAPPHPGYVDRVGSGGSRNDDGGANVRDLDAAVSFVDHVFDTVTVLRAASPDASITSLRDSVITAPVRLGAGVSLAGCDFGGAIGLESLRFTDDPFGGAPVGEAMPRATVAELRALRRAADASGLAQLAAALHIAELDRERLATPIPTARRAWLEFYRLAGGYGHRPSRPIAAWAVMVLAATFVFSTFPDVFVGNTYWVGNVYIDFPRWHQVLTKLMLRTSLTPWLPVDPTRMHSDGFALLVLLKLCTAVLMVFTAMGVRSRLRR